MMHSLFAVLGLCLMMSVYGMPPVSVVGSVRGKKYDITAETVEEFTTKVEEVAGLEAGQHSVLFRGKVLKTGDLDDLGISEGDVLNVVKGRKARPVEVESAMTGGAKAAGAMGAGGMPASLADLQGMSGEALKNPEEMQKAMQAMDQLLDSDFVDEYFSDDEKLEKARLEMLAKLDEYEKMMPGFKAQAQDIAADPKKWKDAMQQAKQQIVSMKAQRDAMRSKGGAGAGSMPNLGDLGNASSSGKAEKDSIDDIGADDEE